MQKMGNYSRIQRESKNCKLINFFYEKLLKHQYIPHNFNVCIKLILFGKNPKIAAAYGMWQMGRI